MLTFLFAWSFLSIAMCWMNENTPWLTNLHAFHLYLLSPLLKLARRDGPPSPVSILPLCQMGIFCPRTGLAEIIVIHSASSGHWYRLWKQWVSVSCNTAGTYSMHSVYVKFNLLMGLCGLQPDAPMIIFCEVVVMVLPQHQQLLCCLHMSVNQFGVCVCVYFAAMVGTHQELQGCEQSS